ncbi:hypothetical protein A3F00_03395 [Candidatus Daviesbacteria bacterium RIFCSPHIGHO2_12_FULL_37_11]|uniref:Uncharacterized protein n=1 Tax=Candidatus Daviesbacteria bacterium RIFCSPHIGHO2_12_FULL_37_11 TaxID=1797777 RepID=A0A1F5KCL3_9BACT|nr:MAG: hypothetical protein A3F00_03395 [Candidatus Daviesbacteria bacterium RIFCSPHIGHO2_12_FULL_37_11]
MAEIDKSGLEQIGNTCVNAANLLNNSDMFSKSETVMQALSVGELLGMAKLARTLANREDPYSMIAETLEELHLTEWIPLSFSKKDPKLAEAIGRFVQKHIDESATGPRGII